MAKPDEWSPKIEAAVLDATATGSPVSVLDLVNRLGCSDGRVRNWIAANNERLEIAGRDQYRAAQYVFAAGDDSGDNGGGGHHEKPEAPRPRPIVAKAGNGQAIGSTTKVNGAINVLPRVAVGESLELVTITRVGDGELEVELLDAQGESVTARLRLAGGER